MLRFMYVNGEIVKRKDAVHVNVSLFFGLGVFILILQPVSSQDVRGLVLHIIADAPPPNWVKVEVCFIFDS